MEQRPKIVRNIVFTWVVLHNMLRTDLGRAHRAHNLENNVVAIQNEQVVHVPDDNYRNPSREAKHQQDLVKKYFNHVGALAGQGAGSEMGVTLGTEEADNYYSHAAVANNKFTPQTCNTFLTSF